MDERIVVINPNSSAAVTAAIERALAPLRMAGGPEIDCVTLTGGPPGIETQAMSSRWCNRSAGWSSSGAMPQPS